MVPYRPALCRRDTTELQFIDFRVGPLFCINNLAWAVHVHETKICAWLVLNELILIQCFIR